MLSSCRLPIFRALTLAALSWELRYGFDVRGVNQCAGRTEFTDKGSPRRRERDTLSVRHELSGRRRSGLKGSSPRAKHQERDVAGKLAGSEFIKLGYLRNVWQEGTPGQLN